MNLFEYTKDLFLLHMETELPSLCPRSGITEQTQDRYCLRLVFKPRKPYHIDKVLEMFDDDADLAILYHRVADKGLNGWHSVCACSRSGMDRMYIFNVETEDDSKVYKVFARIYISLEAFAEELCDELDRQQDDGGVDIADGLSSIADIIFG